MDFQCNVLELNVEAFGFFLLAKKIGLWLNSGYNHNDTVISLRIYFFKAEFLRIYSFIESILFTSVIQLDLKTCFA